MYAVVLAGGGGTRLWPLSTPRMPKPFLPLLGQGSLLAQTVNRLLDGPELRLGPSDVTVVADGSYRSLVRNAVPHVAFLAESAARNTAAAIALAAARIDRPADEVMLVLPADHAVADPAAFRQRLRIAAAAAGEGRRSSGPYPLVTLGIAPDRPATEYGYLVPARSDDGDVARLAAFEEKPVAGRAAELLALGGVAWNAGVFIWRRDAIVGALQRFAPAIWSVVEGPVDASAYAALPSVSIDYAVMEKAAGAGMVAMVTADVGWSDIGSWPALLAVLGARVDGHVVPAGGTVAISAADLLVRRFRESIWVEGGPAQLADLPGPVAVLRNARSVRGTVESLLERVMQRSSALHPPVQLPGGAT
jgi:mannose-1-phosphate guanylyltransferase